MKTIGNVVAFFRPESPLSNWHPCPFSLGTPPVQFNCAEQAMMYAKAKLFGDDETAQAILAAKTPREQKRLGREVRNFDDAVWTARRDTIMDAILFAKFSQNDSLHQALLSTHDKTLVEASPYDKVWGAGISDNDPRITDPTRWPGMNLLGQALSRTRQKLTDAQQERASLGEFFQTYFDEIKPMQSASNTTPMYAIARTEDEGNEGKFIEGPFPDFPHDAHASGAIVFDVTAGSDRKRVDRPVKSMNDYVGHDFMELLQGYTGRFEIFELIQDRMSSSQKKISTKEELGELIHALDEIVSSYAYEMRYEPDAKSEIAKEVVGYAELRQHVWVSLAPNLPSSTEAERQYVAQQQAQAAAQPEQPKQPTTRFNFSRPRG